MESMDPKMIEYKWSQPETLRDGDGFPLSRINYGSDELPPEKLEQADFEPLSFEEMVEALCEDILSLNNFACSKNRFSQGYLDLSRQLERGISELASCCVTKAAFEQQGWEFAGLKDLDLNLFYCIISVHFRKCHDAIRKTKLKNQQFWTQMVDMEMRWYNMARRIKASEDRIALIRAGKVNLGRMIEKIPSDLLPKKEPAAKKQESAEAKVKAESKPRSYPIRMEFLRDELGNQRADAVPEPAAFAAAEEEPKQYATMKQRKKAERLARKHAAQEASVQKNPGRSGGNQRTEPDEKNQIQEQFERYRREFERNCLRPEAAQPFEPYPIGEYVPVRG